MGRFLFVDIPPQKLETTKNVSIHFYYLKWQLFTLKADFWLLSNGRGKIVETLLIFLV